MSSAPRLSAGERWLGATAPIGQVSRTMALVAGASLLAHLAVAGAVAVAGRGDIAPPTEIAVEIVQEVPKPKAELKMAEPAKPVAAKSEPVKSEPAKSEPVKSEPIKSEPAKLEQSKPDITKVARARPQVKPAPPKAEPKVAVAPKAPPPPSTEEAAELRKLATLKQELMALQAEHARLQAEPAEAASPPAGLTDSGIGALPASFRAIVLPGLTDGAGEAASYEAIVFSALAKARGITHRQGKAGTAGVRFSVDAVGKLVAVELIQWSGIPELDAEALAIVRRAAFPQPPQGAQRTFVANVNFEIDRPR